MKQLFLTLPKTVSWPLQKLTVTTAKQPTTMLSTHELYEAKFEKEIMAQVNMLALQGATIVCVLLTMVGAVVTMLL
ncbi:MAG TPA: hypothetical protein DCL43_07455 [Chitinophagaceae bacterium]|nr:hypothetical protein [Chitinophagaceae bacterium]HAN38282.1 hypothetical protein [Chitinophagaceae bacterium]